MNTNQENDSRIVKNKPNDNSKPLSIDFGIRAIVDQNLSKVASLPKIALQNCGKFMQVRVQLVQENGSKYIKLVLDNGIKSRLRGGCSIFTLYR
ncbi:MAG: hypothetical protein ACT4NT_06340 [Nitrososphaerota archaeon]